MGHRPVPEGPLRDYSNNIGHAPDDIGPAYLRESLPKFIARMREQYGDWEEFLDSRPGLERALMSNEDLEW